MLDTLPGAPCSGGFKNLKQFFGYIYRFSILESGWENPWPGREKRRNQKGKQHTQSFINMGLQLLVSPASAKSAGWVFPVALFTAPSSHCFPTPAPFRSAGKWKVLTFFWQRKCILLPAFYSFPLCIFCAFASAAFVAPAGQQLFLVLFSGRWRRMVLGLQVLGASSRGSLQIFMLRSCQNAL